MMIAAILLASTPCTVNAQEAEQAAGPDSAEEAEEPEYRNAISGFIGGITRTERGDSGLAFGLSYGYGVLPKWAVGVKLENATGSIERDWLLLVAFAFEPVDRFELAIGIGPEWVDKAVLEDEETVREEEVEALVRFTVGYAFRVAPRFSLSPEFNVDVGSQVSLVYGLVASFGF